MKYSTVAAFQPDRRITTVSKATACHSHLFLSDAKCHYANRIDIEVEQHMLFAALDPHPASSSRCSISARVALNRSLHKMLLVCCPFWPTHPIPRSRHVE